jgi:hypothetical protein
MRAECSAFDLHGLTFEGRWSFAWPRLFSSSPRQRALREAPEAIRKVCRPLPT